VFFLGCENPEAVLSLSERAQAIAIRYEQEEGGQLEGTVRWFNKAKGYGFIRIRGDGDTKHRNVYFDYSAIAGSTYNTLQEGDLVSFQIAKGEKGPKAHQVRIIPSKEMLNARRKAFLEEKVHIAKSCNSETDIECKVRIIIGVKFGAPFQEVTREVGFVEDLGADSLDIVELIMAFEEEFDIEISDRDAEEALTVGDAIDYIARRKG
jgi:acyl carrier protein